LNDRVNKLKLIMLTIYPENLKKINKLKLIMLTIYPENLKKIG